MGQSYAFQFARAGSPEPTIIVQQAHTLPPGLTLSPSGLLSGTPTQQGHFTFYLSANNGNGLAQLPVLMTVQGPPTVVGPAQPPFAHYGAEYAYRYQTSGLPAPTVSWSGSLPPGLSLDPSTATISGTPTAGGQYQFTITADNGIAPAATQLVTLTVIRPLAIRGTPPHAQQASPYAYQLEVTGFPVPSVNLQSGTLPPGLGLSRTGLLSGTPTTAGDYGFCVFANNGTAITSRCYQMSVTSGQVL